MNQMQIQIIKNIVWCPVLVFPLGLCGGFTKLMDLHSNPPLKKLVIKVEVGIEVN